MPVHIEPLEFEGKHYVDVNLGDAPKRYGPYADAGEASAMAAKFGGIYRIFKGGGLTESPAEKAAARRRA